MNYSLRHVPNSDTTNIPFYCMKKVLMADTNILFHILFLFILFSFILHCKIRNSVLSKKPSTPKFENVQIPPTMFKNVHIAPTYQSKCLIFDDGIFFGN